MEKLVNNIPVEVVLRHAVKEMKNEREKNEALRAEVRKLEAKNDLLLEKVRQLEKIVALVENQENLKQENAEAVIKSEQYQRLLRRYEKQLKMKMGMQKALEDAVYQINAPSILQNVG